MNKLEEARLKINKIDEQMANLFEQRMQAVEDVVAYKIENNMQVLDAGREKDLIKKNLQYIKNEKYVQSYEDYFYSMMQVSRNYQQRIVNKDRVGFGGTKGAFSHIATMQLFPNYELMAYATFEEVVNAVENGEIRYGVIPIENSSAGEVEETSALLRDHIVYIQKIYDLKVTHNLLGVKGATFKDIKKVYSHRQGLAQCALFLKERDFECIPYPNTALAAEMVHDKQDKSIAAIASLETANIFDLDVIEPNINTNKDNTTRFIVISKELSQEGNAFQMMFTLKNETGALAKAINCISSAGYNMSNIKSKAIPNEPWSYYFHVELDGNLKEAEPMLDKLVQYCTELKILGGYTKEEE